MCVCVCVCPINHDLFSIENIVSIIYRPVNTSVFLTSNMLASYGKLCYNYIDDYSVSVQSQCQGHSMHKTQRVVLVVKYDAAVPAA